MRTLVPCSNVRSIALGMALEHEQLVLCLEPVTPDRDAASNANCAIETLERQRADEGEVSVHWHAVVDAGNA
jgi:hypothetical protein